MLQRFLTVIVLTVMMVSCDDWGNHGFKGTVKFPKSGGEKVLTGDDNIIYFCIEDNIGGRVYSEIVYERDTIEASLDWLTVKSISKTNSVTLIAQPSNEKKSRKLYVTLNLGYAAAYVDVKQE